MPHPLVEQLNFARSEFMRGIEGVSDEDAQKRLMPMNCISWNVGHLAWQEQRYWLTVAQGRTILPAIEQNYANGAPASTPSLKEVVKAWEVITHETELWLNALNSEALESFLFYDGKPLKRSTGSLLLRMIYHYWYHTGENAAIRQGLGHSNLPSFVGDIDSKAPYRRG
jgi:uncharacterized damage-inducible protein DinB